MVGVRDPSGCGGLLCMRGDSGSKLGGVCPHGGGGSLAWVRRAPAHKGESELEQGEMGNHRRTQGKGEMVTYKSIDQMSK